MTPTIFESEIWLGKPVEEVFAFFADARNLQALTPAWLDFTVLTPDPILMRAGALIDYRLRLHSFPIRWQTEIKIWEPPNRFVDEQRRGHTNCGFTSTAFKRARTARWPATSSNMRFPAAS